MRDPCGKLRHFFVGVAHALEQIVDVVDERGQFGVLLREMHAAGERFRIEGIQFVVDAGGSGGRSGAP